MTRNVSKCASRNRQSCEDFGIAHGEKPERIRLLFSAKVATYIRERVWHPSQILLEHRNASLEMRLETSGQKELVREVLREAVESDSSRRVARAITLDQA